LILKQLIVQFIHFRIAIMISMSSLNNIVLYPHMIQEVRKATTSEEKVKKKL